MNTKKIFFTFLFLSLIVRAIYAEVHEVNSDFKWYPGHYALVDNAALDVYMQELQDYPVVRGIQKRYYWDEFEVSKGMYDFSVLISDLDYMESIGKYLVIQLQLQTFNNTIRSPAYIQTSLYEGGVYNMSGGGWHLRMWNDSVVARLHLLIDAIGKAVDSHPALALLNISESALGAPSEPSLQSGWSSRMNVGLTNLAGLAYPLRASFPFTPTISYCNATAPRVALFETTAMATGNGHGGPDHYIGAYEEKTNLVNTYNAAKRLSGIVPVGYGVQWHNFTRFGKTDAIIHPIQHYEFSKNVLGSNFMFWVKRDPYWKDVKALWSNLSFMADPAGGLKSDCPSMSPSNCNSPQGTVTPVSKELLVFDFKGSVTEDGKGLVIAQNNAQTAENIISMVPGSNYNWVQPINFHEGTLYLRAEIINQPKPKQMKLQFYVWQDNLLGDKEGIENSSGTGNVFGTTGTISTWSSSIPSLFRKDNVPLDWSRPRESYALVVKNSGGEPVWNLDGENWSGEIPSEWFPLSIRFTAVAVAKDQLFSGWDNYVRAGEYEVPPSVPSSSGELTGYWNFDQTEGNTLLDDSGNENHLTLTGTALQSEGYKGLSIKLDGGTNSMASIEDAALSENFPSVSKGSTVDSLTIASWIYLDAIEERSPILTKEAINNRGFEFGIKNGYMAVQIAKNETDVSRLENSGTQLLSKKWQHVAMTYEFISDGNSVIRLFLDGEENFSMNTSVGPLKNNTAPLRLGAYIWSSTYQRYFKGMIDEINVFSKVLSQPEIFSLMNSSVVSTKPYSSEKTKIEIYPNPVNSSTQILINLKENSQVSLKVLNTYGQELISLISELLPAGAHLIPFSGKNCLPDIIFLCFHSDEQQSIVSFVKK
jgi:hypothetical protein